MSKVHREEIWSDGDVLSPTEPNREISAIVGEVNGNLDRDNLSAGLVTGAKTELDAFHEILWIDGAGPDAFVRVNADPNHWFVVESGTLTTGDGRVHTDGDLTYDTPSGTAAHAECGIRIDGEIVARSGVSSFMESDSLACNGAPTVGPGDHTVELVFRITPGEYLEPVTASLTFTVNGRSLWARYAAR